MLQNRRRPPCRVLQRWSSILLPNHARLHRTGSLELGATAADQLIHDESSPLQGSSESGGPVETTALAVADELRLLLGGQREQERRPNPVHRLL